MSQSSLSSPPSEPSLPILPPTPFVQPSGLHTLQYRKKKPELPGIDSTLFSSNLFSRTLLDTIPPTVQLKCLQLGCIYAPKPQLVSHKQTSNYWTHYKHSHPEIYVIHNPNCTVPTKPQTSQTSSHASDIATLFTPRIPQPMGIGTDVLNHKYRALLLDFVVSNNLALRVVDSQSCHRLIQHCNPKILTISTSTLTQDLDKTFLSAQNTLKSELQEHIKGGGRISITIDAWSARNFKEFIAITGHWINKEWE